MVKVYGVKLLNDSHFLELRGILHATLPREVCDAASRFKYMAGMQRKVLGELMLRAILLRDYGVRSDELRLVYTSKKKPYLESHPQIHFNISHSGQWVVIAFSDEKVGVDIEKIKKVNLGIGRRFFSESEKKALFSLEEKHQLAYFFDLWTLKESFLKAIGTGLTRPLKTFDVLQGPNGFYLNDPGEYAKAQLAQLKVGKDYKLAVCSFESAMDENIYTLYVNELLDLMVT